MEKKKSKGARLQELLEDILTNPGFLLLIPELPLGEGEYFLSQASLATKDGKKIILKYSVGRGRCLRAIGLDTLNCIEKFIEEKALARELVLVHSCVFPQSKELNHEFYFK